MIIDEIASKRKGHLDMKRGISMPALTCGAVVATVVYSLIPGRSVVHLSDRTFASGLVKGLTSVRAWVAPATGIGSALLFDRITRGEEGSKTL